MYRYTENSNLRLLAANGNRKRISLIGWQTVQESTIAGSAIAHAHLGCTVNIAPLTHSLNLTNLVTRVAVFTFDKERCHVSSVKYLQYLRSLLL